MRMEYVSPELELQFILFDYLICTSDGVDPSGSGDDFEWGNSGSNTGINPGGSGDDFSWGN